MMQPEQPESLRLDKWLWAARFFKTRALAKAAIEGGKVHIHTHDVAVAWVHLISSLKDAPDGEYVTVDSDDGLAATALRLTGD